MSEEDEREAQLASTLEEEETAPEPPAEASTSPACPSSERQT